MKHYIIFQILIAFLLISCSKNNIYKYPKDIPQWLKDTIEIKDKQIVENPFEMKYCVAEYVHYINEKTYYFIHESRYISFDTIFISYLIVDSENSVYSIHSDVLHCRDWSSGYFVLYDDLKQTDLFFTRNIYNKSPCRVYNCLF